MPVTNTFAVGGFASAYLTRYRGSFLGNSNSLTFGAAVDGALTPYTEFSVQLGLQSITFEGGSSRIDQAEEDRGQGVPAATFGDGSYLGPYLQFIATNRLNSVLSQRLFVSNQAQPSSSADYAYLLDASYALSWQALSNVTVTFSAAAGYGNNQGLYNDRFFTSATGLRVDYRLTSAVTVFAQSEYSRRDSAAAGQGYQALSGGTGLGYNF